MPVSVIHPVIERIALEIHNRLLPLAGGQSANSSIVAVVRPTRIGGYTPRHLQIVMIQDDPERLEDLDYPGNPPAIAYTCRFLIRCHLLPSEKSTTPIDQLVNIVAADMTKAITAAGALWHTFNSLAIDAEIGPQEAASASDAEPGSVTVPIEVTYRVSELDPYTARP